MVFIDQYETIDGYASVGTEPPVTSTQLTPSTSSVTATQDNDATEPIYLAYKSYRKRKSGEVDLQQGGAVSVLQRELTGQWKWQISI